MAREIVPNINRLAGALRRAGGTIVWIVSTYGPGAEKDWTTFFNFIITGETSDRFRLAFAEGSRSTRCGANSTVGPTIPSSRRTG